MLKFRKCIQPIKAYVPGRSAEEVKRLYNLKTVVKLASNENPTGCSPKIKDALLAGLDSAAAYPDGYCADLRGAVSRFYNIPCENLIFGAGTDEVIAMLGKILIEPGDECITASVTFSQYAAAAESMGGRMVYTPMKNHGYCLDSILAAVTPRTKIIFIANPNNPTGTYFDATAQEEFMTLVPRHIVVVFDEAYQEYVTTPDYPDTWRTLAQYPNAVLLKTFSKIYGIASFRCGFGVCAPLIVEQLEKIRCPFNVTAQAQLAGMAALSDQDFVQQSHLLNRDVMADLTRELAAMNIPCIPSQANFVMADLSEATGRTGAEIFDALMQKGFIIRPGAAFGMDSFIRVTVGSAGQSAGFLQALKEVLANEH